MRFVRPQDPYAATIQTGKPGRGPYTVVPNGKYALNGMTGKIEKPNTAQLLYVTSEAEDKSIECLPVEALKDTRPWSIAFLQPTGSFVRGDLAQGRGLYGNGDNEWDYMDNLCPAVEGYPGHAVFTIKANRFVTSVTEKDGTVHQDVCVTPVSLRQAFLNVPTYSSLMVDITHVHDNLRPKPTPRSPDRVEVPPVRRYTIPIEAAMGRGAYVDPKTLALTTATKDREKYCTMWLGRYMNTSDIAAGIRVRGNYYVSTRASTCMELVFKIEEKTLYIDYLQLSPVYFIDEVSKDMMAASRAAAEAAAAGAGGAGGPKGAKSAKGPKGPAAEGLKYGDIIYSVRNRHCAQYDPDADRPEGGAGTTEEALHQMQVSAAWNRRNSGCEPSPSSVDMPGVPKTPESDMIDRDWAPAVWLEIARQMALYFKYIYVIRLQDAARIPWAPGAKPLISTDSLAERIKFQWLHMGRYYIGRFGFTFYEQYLNCKPHTYLVGDYNNAYSKALKYTGIHPVVYDFFTKVFLAKKKFSHLPDAMQALLRSFAEEYNKGLWVPAKDLKGKSGAEYLADKNQLMAFNDDDYIQDRWTVAAGAGGGSGWTIGAVEKYKLIVEAIPDHVASTLMGPPYNYKGDEDETPEQTPEFKPLPENVCSQFLWDIVKSSRSSGALITEAQQAALKAKTRAYTLTRLGLTEEDAEAVTKAKLTVRRVMSKIETYADLESSWLRFDPYKCYYSTNVFDKPIRKHGVPEALNNKKEQERERNVTWLDWSECEGRAAAMAALAGAP